MKAQLRTILAAVLLVAIPEVHAAVWTGAFVFLCNDRGDASTWVWDTRPGGQLNNISIAAPTHGGWKLMNGPDDYHASINIPLRPGTNVFAISGQGGPPNSAHAAINLFLDSKIAPSISAKRLLDGSFTANSSSNTLDMNATGASAAGVLAYDNGLEIAEVIDFSWVHQGLGAFSGYLTIVVIPKPDILSIRVSEVEICWYSLTNIEYQPVYRSELTTNIWTSFGLPIQGTGGRICIDDATSPDEPKRFDRVQKAER